MTPLSAGAAGALMLALAALSGCGGSNADNSPPAATIPTRCEQPYTWLDDVRKSGNRIGVSAQGEWVLSCAIRSLQTASMTVCLSHPDTTELQLSLVRPDNTELVMPTLATWSRTGTCLSGSPFTTAIAPASLPLQDFSGRWIVRVTDRFPNNTNEGIFHGWSFSLQGLR
jgi:hypothetical protein